MREGSAGVGGVGWGKGLNRALWHLSLLPLSNGPTFLPFQAVFLQSLPPTSGRSELLRVMELVVIWPAACAGESTGKRLSFLAVKGSDSTHANQA